MKKIRAIVLALLCLTIGGVYATWTFADDTSVDRKGQTVTITLEGKAETSEVLGSLAITLSEGFAITIDQKEIGDHTAVLKIADTSSIQLKFTPNDNAAKDVREKGIDAIYYFAATDIKYNDANSDTAGERSIYAIDTATKYEIGKIGGQKANQWTKQGASFVYTIEYEDLVDLIKINTFVIDNSAEYAAFNEVLRSGTITLYLNDAATPAA